MRIGWAIIALCGLIACAVGGLTTGARGLRAAERHATRMREASYPAAGAG